ncbi:MAG: ATP-binding protein [Paludibacteraceae bacterium]|nr:ATP-binding protein [Candidatus Physcocola equi]MCQ2233379.1 ATP-binding protein [Paludibacteraceae bacterium]
MYLRRKIDGYLKSWRENDDKMPLIVKGARQIGKSESILHFANSNYKSVVYINFVTDEKYKKITTDGYAAEDIVRNLSKLNPNFKFIRHETLIVFDEIQEFPEIATSLKFFKLDGAYDVICSGSMLGINYKRIESNSVGYKEDYTMYSLDFEEYLWAKGYSDELISDMLSHMVSHVPFNELEMNVFHKHFLNFCVLGGMPKIVSTFVQENTFERSLKMQRQLLHDYEEDVRKYAEGLDQARILNVYSHIPVQLAKENKKFQISKVASGARFKDYRGCIEWLADSGIVNVCYCLSFPELPLKGNYDGDKYKLYYGDSGLLVASLDDESQEDLRVNDNLGVYKGALYENIIAESFVKQGLGLYYYKREDSTLEEDFFARTKKSLVPVEVKAVSGRSKSLRTLIGSGQYPDIKYGIKLSKNNVGFENDIFTFPYFCSFLLKRYLATVEW